MSALTDTRGTRSKRERRGRANCNVGFTNNSNSRWIDNVWQRRRFATQCNSLEWRTDAHYIESISKPPRNGCRYSISQPLQYTFTSCFLITAVIDTRHMDTYARSPTPIHTHIGRTFIGITDALPRACVLARTNLIVNLIINILDFLHFISFHLPPQLRATYYDDV